MGESFKVVQWNKTQNMKEKIQYIFRRKLPVLYAKYMLKDFPRNVMIETASLCNARCVMCPHGYYGKEKMPKGMMSDELFNKIIDEIKNYNINSVLLFYFGEPLIDKNIVRRIKLVRKELPEVNIIIHTNGSLLTNEQADELVNSGLTRIYFSVEAIRKETYEKIMVGLNYEQTLENIKYFLKLNRPVNLEVKIGLIRHTYLSDEEFNEYIQFWKNVDDRIIIDAPLRASSFAGTLTDENMVRNLSAYTPDRKIVGCHEDRHLKWIHIVSNGEVVLCCADWIRSVVLGNVSENSIYDIWHSEAYNKIRKILIGKERPSEDFICTRCELSVLK